MKAFNAAAVTTRTTKPIKMTGFKNSLKIYSNLWLSISEIFHDFYYNIWRIKLSICLPLSSPFFKVIYLYRTSYFDLIVGSSSVKNDYFVWNSLLLIFFTLTCFYESNHRITLRIVPAKENRLKFKNQCWTSRIDAIDVTHGSNWKSYC